MIGKQVKGNSFRGVLNYLHAKEGSRLIGGNMAGKTPRVLAAEFKVARVLNPNLNKAVYHASLSLPKSDRLIDEQWQMLCDDYVKGMGFEGSQYVVYRHSDREHDHIHIVASRIRISDGSTVSDSWDYRRSETLIRDLEKKYQLTPAPSSLEVAKRGQTTGERRQLERTGEESIRLKLQSLLALAIEPLAMPQLIDRLKERGIDARVSYTRTGKVKGISYQLEGIAFSGTHLGKAYTFPGLQKYRGVTYDKSQDEEIRSASARSPAQPPIPLPTPPTSPPLSEREERSLKQMRRRYRLQYEELQERVRQTPGFENRTQAEINIGVATLLLAESDNPNEIEPVLTQSDLAYHWKRSLPQEEYIVKLFDHIEQTYEWAVKLHQKTALDTANTVRVLLKLGGQSQPDGSVILEGKRWRLSQKDDTVTITVLFDNREILRVEDHQVLAFKPNPSERSDLRRWREQVAQDFQPKRASQQRGLERG